MTKPLICLSVILGNEEAVIERCIRSFAPAVDMAVFCEAIGHQPADKTMDIVRSVCEELDLPYVRRSYLNEQPWPHVDNFAKARMEAWTQAAKTGAKYLIWADADDLLSDGASDVLRTAAESGEKDVYLCPYHVRGPKQVVYRERLIRNDGCSFWENALHEKLVFNRIVETRNLSNVIFTHAPLPDKRKTNPERNLTILEHDIQDDAANLFALAMESMALGYKGGYSIYAKAALAHPLLTVEERYELLLVMAQNEPNCEMAKGHASRAFDLMPHRREALALLSCYALVDGRNQEALSLARIMMSIPKPSRAYYAMNHEWYDWKGFYLYTQTLRANDKEREALRLEREQFQANGATFSICHPTYKRPAQAAAIRDLYLSRAKNPMAIEYIFGLHHDDAESIKLLSGYRHTITDKEGCCPNTLEPMRTCAGKFIMVGADDLFPVEHWDEAILQSMYQAESEWRAKNMVGIQLMPDSTWHEHPFVLNFDDGFRTDGHICHGFMTRPWLEEYLKDPWPGTGIFSDNEFTHRARKAGVIVDAPQIKFEHRHFLNGKAPLDDTYRDQNQRKNYEEGEKLFKQRNPDYEDQRNSGS